MFIYGFEEELLARTCAICCANCNLVLLLLVMLLVLLLTLLLLLLLLPFLWQKGVTAVNCTGVCGTSCIKHSAWIGVVCGWVGRYCCCYCCCCCWVWPVLRYLSKPSMFKLIPFPFLFSYWLLNFYNCSNYYYMCCCNSVGCLRCCLIQNYYYYY